MKSLDFVPFNNTMVPEYKKGYTSLDLYNILTLLCSIILVELLPVGLVNITDMQV